MVNVYSPADPDRPADVDVAAELLGSLARAQIIRYISGNPGTYFGKIRQAVPEMNPNTLSRHLRALEAADVLVVDLPPDERKGRSPHYTVDHSRLTELLTAWITYTNPTAAPAIETDQH